MKNGKRLKALLGWLYALGAAFLLSACDALREGNVIQPLVAAPTVVALPTVLLPAATAVVPTQPPLFLPTNTAAPTPTDSPTATPENTPAATPTPIPFGQLTIIGYSFEERAIEKYQFGQGPFHVIFVGGIHGGYEWNSTLLMYEFMDYLLANPFLLPPAITLHVIPVANPDGLHRVVGHNDRFAAWEISGNTFPGRFNGNNVDLNRNWECNWRVEGVWRNRPVSGGAYPFSEPENQYLRTFIEAQQPLAVIFYHSAFDAIFTAGCPDVFAPSRELAEIYGLAANYPIYDHFPAYEITGDAGDYLATIGIPAFTVELSTHEALDWDRNLRGIFALLNHLSDLPKVIE